MNADKQYSTFEEYPIAASNAFSVAALEAGERHGLPSPVDGDLTTIRKTNG